MDIRHLEYFLKVAELRSFTKAAQYFYVTQPTISKMIRNLETSLGVELFDRTSKYVELTDAGHGILGRAQDIVHAFRNVTTDLEEVMQLKKGLIRIGLPPMIGSSFFPKLLGGFRASYPDIQIHLVENGAKKVEEEVASGELDVGVVLAPVDEQQFYSFSLVEEKLMLLVHPSHPLATSQTVRLEALRDESFLIFKEDFALHDRLIAECVRKGFQPRVLYESSQWDFISQMVAANFGIGLLPAPICQRLDLQRIRVIPLEQPSIPWHLVVIWKRERYMSFAAREWLRFIQDQFAVPLDQRSSFTQQEK